VVKSFVSNSEMRHLSESNCIDPNDSVEGSIKQDISTLGSALTSAIIINRRKYLKLNF